MNRKNSKIFKPLDCYGPDGIILAAFLNNNPDLATLVLNILSFSTQSSSKTCWWKLSVIMQLCKTGSKRVAYNYQQVY